MELFGTNKKPQKPLEYICEKCAFITCNKKDYTRHIKTIKHLGNEMELFGTNKKPQKPLEYICEKCAFICICGKTYKTAAGLWKHKKNCIKQKDSPTNFKRSLGWG